MWFIDSIIFSFLVIIIIFLDDDFSGDSVIFREYLGNIWWYFGFFKWERIIVIYGLKVKMIDVF